MHAPRHQSCSQHLIVEQHHWPLPACDRRARARTPQCDTRVTSVAPALSQHSVLLCNVARSSAGKPPALSRPGRRRAIASTPRQVHAMQCPVGLGGSLCIIACAAPVELKTSVCRPCPISGQVWVLWRSLPVLRGLRAWAKGKGLWQDRRGERRPPTNSCSVMHSSDVPLSERGRAGRRDGKR